MVNTKINYLYRDASNYKQHNEVVIAGKITEQQISTIVSCLSDGEYFIPKQVGLPETRFSEWTEDDHCWFELSRYSFENTDRIPTIGITIEELISNFEKAKDNWDDSDPNS